jgi:hypothetical protein
MRHLLIFVAGGLLALPAQTQMIGNAAHPVLMIAKISEVVALCEAAHAVFRGKTLNYLLDVDRIAPGYLESVQLQNAAQEIVKAASLKDLSDVTEDVCREKIAPLSQRAIKALPCYSKRDWTASDWNKCPRIGE